MMDTDELYARWQRRNFWPARRLNAGQAITAALREQEWFDSYRVAGMNLTRGMVKTLLKAKHASRYRLLAP